MRRLIIILAIMSISVCRLSSQNLVYQPGEKVSYLIQYGVLTGGKATLELFNDTCFNQKTYHARLTGYTSGLVDAVYKVRDIYECHLDPSNGLPLKSIRNISEGKYKKKNIVTFDRETRADSAILNSDLTGIHIKEKEIHDILSCFYYFRNNILPQKESKMRKGDTFTINTWFTDEYFPIVLRYEGIEEIKTKAGKIKCYKFNPVCEIGRLFKSEDGLSIWFSADKNYLPVKIRFEIFVGAFEVDMYSYEGLKYPLEFKTK